MPISPSSFFASSKKRCTFFKTKNNEEFMIEEISIDDSGNPTQEFKCYSLGDDSFLFNLKLSCLDFKGGFYGFLQHLVSEGILDSTEIAITQSSVSTIYNLDLEKHSIVIKDGEEYSTMHVFEKGVADRSSFLYGEVGFSKEHCMFKALMYIKNLDYDVELLG